LNEEDGKITRRFSIAGGYKWWVALFGGLVGGLACCPCLLIGLFVWMSDPLMATWYTNHNKEYLQLELNRGNRGWYKVNGTPHALNWKREDNVLHLEMLHNATLWNGAKESRFTYSIINPEGGMSQLTLAPFAADEATMTFTRTKLIPGP
jgi:hypothetical protein